MRVNNHNLSEVHPPQPFNEGQKRTKILYIITQGELGGAQRYVADLTTHLDKNRYDIVAAVGNGQDALSKNLENLGYKVLTVKNLTRNIHPLKDIAAILEIKKIIKKINPDIIHLNSSKAGVLGSFAAKLEGNKNVVFTAHGFAFLEPHAFKFIYFWAEKLASFLRKVIITVSEYDREQAIKYKLCPPEKLVTIHNGIEINDSEFQTTSYQLPATHLTIGTIAHDYPTKDLNTLREAFALVKKDYPNAELVIIGRGGTTGELPNTRAALEVFDIYVCSSVKEGFPYSILEAMRAGLPIVSTAVGGIPEAIEHGKQGLLVPPKNPEAMAMAIKKLIANPKLAEQLGRNARKKIKKFSLKRMVEETEAVYRKLVTSN